MKCKLTGPTSHGIGGFTNLNLYYINNTYNTTANSGMSGSAGSASATSVAGSLYTQARNERELAEGETVTIENVPPDCNSFEFSRVGTTNWQTAAVTNVHELFTIINWTCIGYDWGIFTQPLYFQLPINIKHPLNSSITKIESAAYLDSAFRAFDVWYKRNGCNTGGSAMEQKLLEYIKDEFEENGGKVTLTPPLGFSGSPKPYKITWAGYGDCN